tara:strand:- start:1722 stop:1910 length:189 start_codon:yes stop_codon:yes gene_type:complete
MNSFPVRSKSSKNLQNKTNNKVPNSPKTPKSKSKSNRKNPLRQGGAFKNLNDLIKHYAEKQK